MPDLALRANSLLCTMAGEGIAPHTVSLIHPRGIETSRRTSYVPRVVKDTAIIAYSRGFVQPALAALRSAKPAVLILAMDL